MGASSHYFFNHLSEPCVTFQLLLEAVVKPVPLRKRLVPRNFRRNIGPEMACVDCCESTWDKTACLLPDLINEHSDRKTCKHDTAASWTLLPFQAATLIAVVSALLEIFLLYSQSKVTVMSKSITSIRNTMFAALQVLAINATLVVATQSQHGAFLDRGLFFGSMFAMYSIALVTYFGKEPSLPFYLATLEGAVLAVIQSHGTVDASTVTCDLLSAACVLRAAAIVAGNETSNRSTLSTLAYTGSLMFLYLGIAWWESQAITLQYNSLVMRVAEVLFGLAFAMLVSAKTGRAFQELLESSAQTLSDETTETSLDDSLHEDVQSTSEKPPPESFVTIMESTPPLAPTALALTVQDWHMLGFGDDPSVAATTDLEVTVDRITALFLVRIVAVVEGGDTNKYTDLSTSTICRTALMSEASWPEAISNEMIVQLRKYVSAILTGYNDVPYHNFEHAYHVTISVNKLVDMMLQKEYHFKPTYGLRSDPLMHLALLMAALIHDVEHMGIPNRQLSIEEDELAILYNDLSIAEQRSLHVGFSLLGQPAFAALRAVAFPCKEEYLRFRKAVVNLVLNTDIANPERTQVGKSKWKEAFGETLETVERKVQAEVLRRSSAAKGSNGSLRKLGGSGAPPSVVMRRGSNFSIRSEVTNPLNEEKSDEKGIDTDDSFSGTPDSSDNEDERADPLDGVIVSGYTLTASPVKKRIHVARRSSLNKLAAPLEEPRRQSIKSMPAILGNVRRKRLGIRRSMDLSGEALETYSKSKGAPTPDLPDELKATVVMEAIMTAADVAHNLQGWQHMTKWSDRLYMELRKAHVAGRGADAKDRWYENQIGFLECYLLPLARKLNDTKVFGETMGPAFANIVIANRDRWLEEGLAVSTRVIKEGGERFPAKVAA